MDDVFSAEGFDRGYNQAINDIWNIYKDCDKYDEIYVSALRRELLKLKNDTE